MAPLQFPLKPALRRHGAVTFDQLLGSVFRAKVEKFDLVLDREHAVILRIRAYLHDATVGTVELADVAFDEP